jgi:sialidase-1
MRSPLTRRDYLKTTTALALTGGLVSNPAARAVAADSLLLETTVISRRPDIYHGWPTVALRKNGELLLVCSSGREAHVCPFGKVDLWRSGDQGKTWSWPQTILDGPIDDRDAGVLETVQGTILITTFSSLAYEPILAKAETSAAWPPERLAKWLAAHQRVSASERQTALGVWMVRSTDGGLTFSRPYDALLSSPHGPIQLADGRLLYAGKDLWRKGARVGVCESTDDGLTWQMLAAIPVRPGDDAENYHELHAVEASDGTLIVQIRSHNKTNSRETLQCESTDGGKTWSVPHTIGVWGLPSHLLRLRDKRLLMTYGYRRKPFGNQARISEDHGRSWSEPISISEDGINGDLGYPSTVQFQDETLLTVWYERMKENPRAVLRQCHWRLA